MKNSGVNVFEGIPVGKDEAGLLDQFLGGHDFAPGTRRLIVHDVRQFAGWFSASNKEPFVVGRVTVRDVVDFRDHLRREKQQAVSTVNRSLVLLRRFFGWLADQGHVPSNPAKPVKELKRQALAPKGLDRSQVRKLLREVELRQDTRSTAIFCSRRTSPGRLVGAHSQSQSPRVPASGASESRSPVRPTNGRTSSSTCGATD